MLQATQTHFERFLRPILASRFLTISAIIHLIIIMLFGGKALFNKYVEPPDFTASGDGGAGADAPQAPEPPPQATLPPPPSAAAPPPVSVPTMTTLTTMNPSAQSTFSMPLPVMAPPSLAPGPTAQAAPSLAPSIQVPLPEQMKARAEGEREDTGKQYGERAPSEQAVVRALRWLQATQHTDGTWGEGGTHSAFTGLAILCFLGHGETPQGSHEFGVVVGNAINALVTQSNAHDGRLTGRDNISGEDGPYQHAICTYALCEAYTMTKDPRLEPVVRKAVDYILRGQRMDGGWTYGYDITPNDPTSADNKDHAKSDTSVTGWQIQALKAAHLTGLPNMDGIIPALNNSMKSLDAVFDPKQGSFGYRKAGDKGGNYSLTGVGVLSKLFWLGRPDRTVREGLKNITSLNLDYRTKDCNLYAWYYDTQACYQAQGSAWDWWNSRFQDMLTSQQSADGSWPPTGGQFKDDRTGKMQPSEVGNFGINPAGDGPIYRTALCTLMLEVFYRYLPTSREDALGASTVDGL
jgi:hypothetical protein